MHHHHPSDRYLLEPSPDDAVFLAGDFFAPDFLAAVFFAGDFFAADFFAGDFFAAVFLAAGMAISDEFIQCAAVGALWTRPDSPKACQVASAYAVSGKA